MDFSDVLARSVHDIKNSLGMILNNIDDLLSDPVTSDKDQSKLQLLQYEAKRANNNLIQLLSLYKLEKHQLTIDVAEQNLADFLEEFVAENVSICSALGLTLECVCTEEICGYFDEDLVRGVISSTIGNAQRYARRAIQIGASSEQGYVVIRVEDDGSGYPAHMIDLTETHAMPELQSFSSGRTHLGLYFALQVAQLHTQGSRRGHIQLTNANQLKGSCFELWLP